MILCDKKFQWKKLSQGMEKVVTSILNETFIL